MAINGTSGKDRLVGDLIFGIATDDEINGFAGDDELIGRGGDDILRGGAGADTLIGGNEITGIGQSPFNGFDWAYYDLAPAGVGVSTGNGRGSGFAGEALGDVLLGISGIVGSRFDDEILGGSGDNKLLGDAGDDLLDGRGGADLLSGGAGVDTASYASSAGGVTVQLDQAVILPFGSGAGGDADGDLLIAIENLVGSSSNDVLTGNSLANYLRGGDGDDVLAGLAGDDTLDGGDDDDTISGGAGADGLLGGNGDDDLAGNDGDDVLDGGAGRNTLAGGAGDDILVSGDGVDVLDGGSGRDRAVFLRSVVIDLTLTTQSGGNQLISIEDIEGSDPDPFLSQRSDTLRGNSLANGLFGKGGDDLLEGRGGGDTLDGGSGVDTASYESSLAGVNVRLADPLLGTTSFASGGDAAGDRLASIERLIGSRFRDVLTGNSDDNNLSGGNGDDDLFGLDGDDTLDGGDGVNFLDGGAGNDTLISGARGETLVGGDSIEFLFFGGDTVVYDQAPGSVSVVLRDGADGSAATTVRFGPITSTTTDVLRSVENVLGSEFGDSFLGNSNINIFSGRGGDDLFFTDRGDDFLSGGGGFDTLDLSRESRSVTTDIRAGLVTYAGSAERDTIVGFERISGTSLFDVFRSGSSRSGDQLTFAGRSGDDVYFIDNALTLVEERAGEGFDIVQASVDWTLGASQFVEVLTVASPNPNDPVQTNPVRLTGNELANTIRGDSRGNVLVGAGGNDVVEGNGGDDILIGGDGDDTLNGGTEIDTADFSSSLAGVRVNLSIAGSQATGQGSDTFIGVENVVGGAFADRIAGNAAANTLTGGEGDDTLISDRGDDTLDGGDGMDTVDLSGESIAAIVDGQSLRYVGSSERDTALSIEKFIGTRFGDQFTVLSGSKVVFAGGLGDDVYIVNDSSATLLETSGQGVDRVRATVSFGLAAGQSIEVLETFSSAGTSPINLTGNELDNTIFGNAGRNTLSGGAGNDRLEGQGGNDTLAGGEGDDFLNGGLPVVGGGPEIDTADYGSSRVGVRVDLSFIGPQDTGQGFDTLFSIENVVGGAFDDVFIGTEGVNAFNGAGGVDTVSYANAAGAVAIRLNDGTAATTGGVIDQLVSIESAIGSAFSDLVVGQQNANRLEGGAGDDTLQGLGGGDVLIGGDGDDLYDFTGAPSLGSDIFIDGGGADTALFDFRGLSVVRDGADLVVANASGSFRVVGHFSGAAIESAKDALTGNVVTLAIGLVGGDANGIIAGTKKGETLDGRGGDDFLFGDGGRDTLFGGAGDDHIDGGRGADILIGGAGDDTLTGGRGADLFVVAAGSGRDVVTDFERGRDRIDLSAFRTSFRSLDSDRDRILEAGEGNGQIKVVLDHGSMKLSFAGGSLALMGAQYLSQDDFLL